MKKLNMLLLSAVAAFAVDYSAMTLTELQAARGTVAEADRSAFQAEMQTRVQALSPEERAAMSTSMKQSKTGPQDGTGSQMRTGGGGSSMGTGTSMGSGTKMQRRSGR